MSDKRIMGVDPGLHSIGICVLKNTRVSMVLQLETRPKDRKSDTPERWLGILRQAIEDAHPTVIAIEDFEPQPWKTGGKIPRGGVALQKLVSDMRRLAESSSGRVYTQSPGIQSEYDDVVVRKLITQAMGSDYKPLPHLVSATKHAMYAEAAYNALVRSGGKE